MVACRDSSLPKPAVEGIQMVSIQSASVSYVACCEDSTNHSSPGKMLKIVYIQ